MTPLKITRNTPSILTLIVSLIATALSGCAIGSSFKPPTSSLAEQWMAAGQKQLVGKPADPIAWWRVFNDPLLDALVDQAQH